VALYAAKADGSGKIAFFEPRLEASTIARRALESDLRLALVNDEFRLYYQPIVDLRDGRIVSVEALLRWQHPQRGLLAPGEFLAAAEETGLIVPIGDWAVRQLCADAVLWPDDARISFNGSTLQLRDQGFADSVAATLAEYAVRPERVAVEVTEKCLGEYSRDCLATLEKLRAAGVQIVMDDFGMGRSSLDDLRRFRFDRIKIDCSFMSTLSDDLELSLAITQAAATVARLLGVPATAESVETEEQLRLVSAAGCTEFQGRLFSPPRPADEIVRLFQPSAVRPVSRLVG
jgi:EAL domain-containing protein (putative c-di-GMP-specific phosphodiesterase class I)